MARGTRRGWGRGIGSLMGPQLNALGIGDKIREYTAPLIWAEIVGPQIASATEVEKVQDGVLYVSTRSSTWAQELNFHKNDIVRRLNQRLGATQTPVITDIRFRNRVAQTKPKREEAPPLIPTPEQLEDTAIPASEMRAIDHSVEVIADPALRERLRKLRRSDARLRYWRIENGWRLCEVCGEMAPPRFPQDGTQNCIRCRLNQQVGRQGS